MELPILLFILLFLAFLVLVFVLPVRGYEKAKRAEQGARTLGGQILQISLKIESMEKRLRGLEIQKVSSGPAFRAESVGFAETQPLSTEWDEVRVVETLADDLTEYLEPVAPLATPPALPLVEAPVPPVATRPAPVTTVPAPEVKHAAGRKPPVMSLEQFMGVKLFAWLGGLALFFGIAFFVKYSFEHNLIPPAARVAIGFVIGAGLLAAGIVVHRKKDLTVLAQTFCASGVLILYGVSFAAHSLYQLFGDGSGGALLAFSLMALITAAAFLLSVRLNALVVAVLGILGGFLTPVLCSSGEDNHWGLFTYIALLDIGLLMVAKHRRWFFLTLLGAAGTVLMQWSWFASYFSSGHYDEGIATLIPMGVVLSFTALFTFGAGHSRLRAQEDPHPLNAALLQCAFGLVAAFHFLNFDGITSRPFLLYGYTFLINIAVLGVIFIAPRLSVIQVAAGLVTFLHLSLWTLYKLPPERLGSALVIYLVFGILHAAFPLVWRRLREGDLAIPRAFSPWFPPFTILLMLLPVLRLEEVPFIIWPAILLADLCVIAAAIVTGMLLPLVAALVLTLGVVFSWLVKVPAQITELPLFLMVLGGFSAVFAIAGCWLAKRYPGAWRLRGEGPCSANDQVAAALPVLSAALPFLLLIMATLRLPVLNPSPVFGLGLLLVLLLLGLAKIVRLPALSVASLGCMLALEASWHSGRFDPDYPWIPLGWYIGVHLLFAAYPFFFRNTFKQNVLPWAAAAASGIGHFVLTFLAVKSAFPGMAGRMGLLPVLFAVPPLVGLLGVLRVVKSEGEPRTAQLAWFGGTALLFITLIFPIQLDRQWLTISWALEGAALIWLFRRVPHPGLIGTGVVLLGVAFARLALNPEVLGYYPRGATPILNWHLYTYGIAAGSLMLGARWLMAPHDRFGGINLRGTLYGLGGGLLFVLLNIEIADFFTEPGARFITLSFGGNNFARDMTYSIAWGLFALGLLVIGFILDAKGARYAGIALMAVTLLKLFLHDLAYLSNIYRIGALMVVAVIALLASFLYQRFFGKMNKDQ